MATVKYIRKVPIMKLVFGVLLFIFSIFLVLDDIKGLILSGLAVYFILIEGTEFNFETMQFRKVKSFLGMNFGRWQPLPKIDYVSVFSTNEATTLRSRSAETNVKNPIIKINLFYNGNHRIEVCRLKDKNEAFEIAKDFSERLEIDILDATGRESKWL
ncbi:hypothetical protein [Winogradskyella sp. A3E31]|uniref:hypothetical protein n=1 Tax=Winogradskyella sp. A3E31 TaxID=3349637 RepID=UPI00398AA97C